MNAWGVILDHEGLRQLVDDRRNRLAGQWGTGPHDDADPAAHDRSGAGAGYGHGSGRSWSHRFRASILRRVSGPPAAVVRSC